LFSNSYGYGLYKSSQVIMGNPYKIDTKTNNLPKEKKAENMTTKKPEDNSDNDLRISQDIIHKAREEAALILHETKLQAEKILSEANEKAELMYAEIKQKAKEEGYRHGEMLAQQHYNDLINEAQDFKNKCETLYQDALSSLEKELVDLILNIAAKVVGDEIKNNREAVLNLITDTIESCTNHQHVILKVSAEDYEFVFENREKIYSKVSELDELEIRKDPALAPGSCIVDTGFGLVDGSCDTRLENIREAFFGILGENEK
jgi:flagellar assembly protein FliH